MCIPSQGGLAGSAFTASVVFLLCPRTNCSLGGGSASIPVVPAAELGQLVASSELLAPSAKAWNLTS
eukprot:1160763-Pelagomonas_calceolata.AAC.11